MPKNKQNVFVVVLTLVCALVLVGVNAVTAPIISAGAASAQTADLYEVLPGASGFECLYSSEDPASSSLVNVADTIKAIYREANGNGFGVQLSTTKGFTGDAIEFALGIDSEGKITGTKLTAYPESKDFGADYPSTYIGQDATLADVSIVGGVTYSSSAFKGAVEDAFACLVANELLFEAQKGAAQLLTEMLPTVCPGMATPSGTLQFNEKSGVMVANNNSTFAKIVDDVLVLANTSGEVTVLDIDGNDVSESHSDLVSEMQSFVSSNVKSSEDKDIAKIKKLLSDSVTVTKLSLGKSYGCTTAAYEVKEGKTTYYVFFNAPYGFSNETMKVQLILDSNGAIVKLNVDEYILEGEFFTSYTLDKVAYPAGFVGLDQNTYSEDVSIITGATVSSNAISSATVSSFAAYNAIKGGNE